MVQQIVLQRRLIKLRGWGWLHRETLSIAVPNLRPTNNAEAYERTHQTIGSPAGALRRLFTGRLSTVD